MRHVLAIFIVLPLLAVSCSRTEPQIPFGFLELVYYQSTGRPLERFSFFIIAEDEDGIENLTDLYLYHDRDQLRWHFTSNDWIRYTEGGSTWIGSRSVAIGEGERLPRGQYRAILVNNGGERGERLISFDAPEESAFPFPTLEIQEGRFTVNSAYPDNSLVFYDEQGNFLFTASLSNLSGTLGELGDMSDAQAVALWAQDTQRFTSAFTNVAALH